MNLEIVFEDGRKVMLDGVASFSVTEGNATSEEFNVSEVVQPKVEGKFFEVNPLGIDRSKFENPMSDRKQEWTRQIIQEAFDEVDKHPEKYGSSFYTMVPEKKWNGYKKVTELKTYANDLGGMIADWVEQALEWAQRIFNGESWETICNNKDTANCQRMILWKNGAYRHVGGSQFAKCALPESFIDTVNFGADYKSKNTVPMVVFKIK